jgi:hypothetical protein
LGVEIVTVFIGKERQPFLLHKDRLCKASPYFNGAFNGNFKEAQSNEIGLGEVDVTTFELFTEWLYRTELNPTASGTHRVSQYIELYILSDMLQCGGLKNMVMDLIQDCLKSMDGSAGGTLSSPQIERIFGNTSTSKNSPLRKFCAALVSFNISTGQAIEDIEEIFAVKGFAKEYSNFRQEWREIYEQAGSEGFAGLVDDPRERGIFEAERMGDVVDAGFEGCFFHVHGKGDQCGGSTN